MYRIIAKKELAPKIKLLEIEAPAVAAKSQAGQFVILRVDEKGERIPLTLVDWKKVEGTITLIFLEIGASTEKLGKLDVGHSILDICGPLGRPTVISEYGIVAVIGGGVGTASAYPIARALKQAGNNVTVIIAAKTAELVILEREMKEVSDTLYISTDDGTKGQKGFAVHVLKKLIDEGSLFDAVWAIGPTVMMRSIADATKPYGIHTIVSLNPIMVDGMGMCGACRVTVGGDTKFACVDGPEFDAHSVDFGELMKRQLVFLSEEKTALQHYQESCGCHE